MVDTSPRLLRIFFLSLLVPAVEAAAQGYVTGLDPEAIRQTLTQGTSTNVSLMIDYDNTNNVPVGYIIYVQDDTSCPNSLSSHSWIPLTPTPGMMPAQFAGVATVSVPLNTTGLSYGTYVTNVCFVANDPNVPTNVAVPVTLKAVAADDIFMDGFE
jgi:hypothetical protein